MLQGSLGLSQNPVGAECVSQNCLIKESSGNSWALCPEVSGSVVWDGEVGTDSRDLSMKECCRNNKS